MPIPTIKAAEIPSDPRQLLPYSREELDDLERRGVFARLGIKPPHRNSAGLRSDPFAPLRAVCCWPFELMRTSLLARFLMFPLYLVYLVFAAIASSFGNVGNSITNALFRDPHETYARDVAKRDGAIVDDDGNVVGARIPMRASALVILYVLTAAEWFIVLSVLWGAWLAARYLLSLEKFPIRAVVRNTVFGETAPARIIE